MCDAHDQRHIRAVSAMTVTIGVAEIQRVSVDNLSMQRSRMDVRISTIGGTPSSTTAELGLRSEVGCDQGNTINV